MEITKEEANTLLIAINITNSIINDLLRNRYTKTDKNYDMLTDYSTTLQIVKSKIRKIIVRG